MLKPFFCFIILFLGTAFAETALIAGVEKNITFNASSLDAFSSITIATASWDFADDTTGEGLVVTHSFVYEGIYNISVEVEDNLKNKYSSSFRLMVGNSVSIVPSDATYVAIYIPQRPEGVFTLTVNQSASSPTSTGSLVSIEKFFGISSNMTNGQFTARLVFSYDDQDDDGMVDGTSVNENTLGPYYYDGSWRLIPSTINTNANLITADVDHFTEFAILSSASQSSTPVTDGGGGGGGGGGSVGTASNPTASNQTVSQCNASWTCTEWSACLNSIQTRSCSDTNNCNNSQSPALSMNCSANAAQQSASSEILPGSSSLADYLVIGVCVALAAVVVVFFVIKNRGKKS
jgi:hypothetical protein